MSMVANQQEDFPDLMLLDYTALKNLETFEQQGYQPHLKNGGHTENKMAAPSAALTPPRNGT